MRVSTSPFANPTGLVDKRVGRVYATIEEVIAALPKIEHLSYYLETLFNLQRNLDALSHLGIDHHILLDVTTFQGANAYELALQEGFEGTIEEWLQSLVGPQGETGFLDEEAHQVLIDGIAANYASIAGINVTLAEHTSAFANYLTTSAFDIFTASLASDLTTLEESILDQVPDLIPPLDEVAVTNIANLVFDTAIVTLNDDVSTLTDKVDAAETLLSGLREDLDAGDFAFNEFLIQNDLALTRITALEAVGDLSSAAILELQTVTTESASLITTLEAESATHFSSIAAIELVNANTAIQINALQVSNNANFASIESIQEAYVDADEAAATDRAAIRAEFAAADDGVASTAAAAVSAESSARATALGAAATDRAAIRAEFALADDGVFEAAEALVVSEASARATADGVNASSILTLSATVDNNRSEVAAINWSDIIYFWDWSSGTVDGWTVSLATASYPAAGGIRLTAPASPAAPDVWIRSPVLSFDGSRYYKVVVDLECVSGAGGTNDLSLYYQTSGHGESGSYRDLPRVNTAFTAGERRLLVYDMDAPTAGGSDWVSNTITRIRFDLPQNANSVYIVHSIKIVGVNTQSAIATVSVTASAVADIEGRLAASYAIQVDGGGNGALISLEDGTEYPSAIILSADEITLDGDVIITGTLNTAALAANAVTNVQTSQTASSISLASGSYVTVASFSFTSVGIGVEMRGSADVFLSNFAPNDPGRNILWRIRRDSTVLKSGTVVGSYDSEDVGGGIFYNTVTGTILADYNDIPSSGTYTYDLQILVTNSGGTPGLESTNRFLSAREFKR
jgi:hypothetical protein